VVLVVLWIAAGTYARATYEPLAPRGGGYEAGLIGWSAHGTFALEPPEATDGTPDEPSGELVHVEVVRPTPLHAWRLKRLEHERP
jgi:hypothetical protein